MLLCIVMSIKTNLFDAAAFLPTQQHKQILCKDANMLVSHATFWYGHYYHVFLTLDCCEIIKR